MMLRGRLPTPGLYSATKCPLSGTLKMNEMTKEQLEAKKKEIDEKLDNSTSCKEIDELLTQYNQINNELEAIRLKKRK